MRHPGFWHAASVEAIRMPVQKMKFQRLLPALHIPEHSSYECCRKVVGRPGDHYNDQHRNSGGDGPGPKPEPA
jgi:hypothetical protein